jgi:tRNA pseudouridine55 synthase
MVMVFAGGCTCDPSPYIVTFSRTASGRRGRVAGGNDIDVAGVEPARAIGPAAKRVRRMDIPCGFLVLNKPAGITSRAAVDRAARWFPRRTRLGHTGTLDPLATGVLVLAVGQANRLSEYVQQMEKVYRAGIRLGASSDTDDADGHITPTEAAAPSSREAVEHCLQALTGQVLQTPPAFSAAKVAGRRAYRLARGGDKVELAARTVRIYDIGVLHYEYPQLDIEVRCGKGTYIRALARDLGQRLGCGGYIGALRRTRVGPFEEAAALSLDADRAAAQAALLDMTWGLHGMPRLRLSISQAQGFAQGQTLAGLAGVAAGTSAVFDKRDHFLGVGEMDEQGLLRPIKVIMP